MVTHHASRFTFRPYPPLAVLRTTLYDTPTFVKPLTSYTSKLTDPQAAALRAWLQAHNYRFREVPYARFAAEKEKTNVVFYESGKLVVQGKGTQEFADTTRLETSHRFAPWPLTWICLRVKTPCRA